jgi:hypothetical protein
MVSNIGRSAIAIGERVAIAQSVRLLVRVSIYMLNHSSQANPYYWGVISALRVDNPSVTLTIIVHKFNCWNCSCCFKYTPANGLERFIL